MDWLPLANYTNFQPSEILKALVYFNDGDLNSLTMKERQTLIEAVKSVRELPEMKLSSKSLGSSNDIGLSL